MLTFLEKVEIFTKYLNQKEISYADSFNATIFISAQNFDFDFLKKLHSRFDIKNWIEKLKSRIVMREDDELLEEIIENYISVSLRKR